MRGGEGGGSAGSGPGEGQWRGLKAMAVGHGHGTAGDGRESGRGQASGDDLRAGRLPCDYASSDGRTWPGVEMAVTLLEIREDHV